VLAAELAFAQAPEALSPELRARFEAGVRAQNAGDCRAALEAFDDVAQVQSTPSLLMQIGACEEQVGDLVRAVASYRRALAEAQETGASEVAARAQEAVTRVAPRIPRLTIRLLGAAKGALVTLDDRQVSAEALSGSIPVNPGEHRIVATLSGRPPVEVRVDARESKTRLVRVRFPEDEAQQGATEAPADGDVWGTLGWVGLAVGAAALVTSGVFFALKQGAVSDLETQCDGRACPPESQDTIDRGRTYTTVSNVALIVGLVAATGGGLALAVGPKPEPGDTGAPGRVIAVHFSSRF
jgi:hypothetical protein